MEEFSGYIRKRKIHDNCNKITSNPVEQKKRNENCELKTPKLKLTEAIENTIEIPKVNGLCNLAGLEEIKKMLKTLFLLPIKHPQLFVNRKTSNKLLLFGPPGTGKTLLAHAVAAEMKAVFHNISSSDVLSPLVGESEKYKG